MPLSCKLQSFGQCLHSYKRFCPSQNTNQWDQFHTVQLEPDIIEYFWLALLDSISDQDFNQLFVSSSFNSAPSTFSLSLALSLPCRSLYVLPKRFFYPFLFSFSFEVSNPMFHIHLSSWYSTSFISTSFLINCDLPVQLSTRSALQALHQVLFQRSPPERCSSGAVSGTVWGCPNSFATKNLFNVRVLEWTCTRS